MLLGGEAGGELGSRSHAGLLEDVLQMLLDGVAADRGGGGDLQVAKAARNQLDHLTLPR